MLFPPASQRKHTLYSWTPRGGGKIHAVRPVCVKQTEGINEKLRAIFCLINFRAEDGMSRCATTDFLPQSEEHASILAFM